MPPRDRRAGERRRAAEPEGRGAGATNKRARASSATNRDRPAPGPPMDLANMRENGVRRLQVRCWRCYHAAVLYLEGYDGAVLVQSFGPRMVCTRCGIIGATRGRTGRTSRGGRRCCDGRGGR